MIWLLLFACTTEDLEAAKRIGPLGGQVALDDVSVTIPEGALDQNFEIRIRNTQLKPRGYGETYIYAFEPEGLTFQRPVWVTFPGDTFSEPEILWTQPGEEDLYRRLFTEHVGRSAVARVDHFSRGFVAADEGETVDTDTDL